MPGQVRSAARMKRRFSQWMLVTGIVNLVSLGAMILFERASTKVADSVLTPWFAICRDITPVSWQVRGNILLGMLWLFSGVLVYSMLIGVMVVSFLAIVERRRKLNRSLEANEQPSGVTPAMSTAAGALPFLILFSTLVLFVLFGTDSESSVATSGKESALVTEKPRRKRVENTLPIVAVYAGRIRLMRVDKDFREITGPTERILRT